MHRPDVKRLPEDRRREIFLALVETQDKDLSVPQSRAAVARRFDLSVEEVRQIEREGLDAAWPPLCDAWGALCPCWTCRWRP